MDYGDYTTPTDGIQITEPNQSFEFNHVYDSLGEYTVTVTVRDQQNQIGYDTFIVNSTNDTPIVDAGEDETIHAGRGGLWRAVSFIDPDPDSWTVSVDYGDGTTSTFDISDYHAFGLNHIYDSIDLYTVTVTVT